MYFIQSYNNYLNSQKWKNRRLDFKQKYPEKCYYCSNVNCDLHHLSYRNLGNELDIDLRWLCRKHHKEIHGKIDLKQIKQIMKEEYKCFKERYNHRIKNNEINDKPFIDKNIAEEDDYSYLIPPALFPNTVNKTEIYYYFPIIDYV